MTTSREELQTTETADGEERVADGTPRVNAREIHEDRVVFTETGNTDGWISTDLTVTPAE